MVLLVAPVESFLIIIIGSTLIHLILITVNSLNLLLPSQEILTSSNRGILALLFCFFLGYSFDFLRRHGVYLSDEFFTKTNFVKIFLTKSKKLEKVIEISLIWTIPRLWEYRLDNIVPVLIEHDILKDLRVSLKKLKEKKLRVRWFRCSYSTLHNVWGNLLSAIVSQFVADKLRYLHIDFSIIVLYYLLYDIVPELIIY